MLAAIICDGIRRITAREDFCNWIFTTKHGLRQGYFLCTWLGTHATTMSQDVTDIRGERADFASGDRGGFIFIGLFSKEKDLWLFGRAPSASQKSQRETNCQNDASSDTRKICEEPGISVIVCDIVVAWSSCPNTP